MSLPNTYRQLEYIQSSGTQYINLNFVLKAGDIVEFDFVGLGIESGKSYGFITGVVEDSITIQPYIQNNSIIPSVFTMTSTSLNVLVNARANITKNTTIPLFVFSINNYGSPHNKSKLKLYDYKIYRDSQLVRDYVPVKRLSDNVLGLYDLVNDQFYTNAGSGTFVAGTEYKIVDGIVNPNNSGTITGLGQYMPNTSVQVNAIANSGYEFENWLLKGYTQLEYIESSGTQYIDTDFTPNNNTRIETTAQFLNLNNGNVIAIVDGNSTNDRAFGLNIWNNNLYWCYGDNFVYTSTFNTNKHLFRTNNNQLYIDGVLTLTANNNSFTSPHTLSLFGWKRQGSIIYWATLRLWGFKIWNSNTLVRDYIPVIRHSDGAIGLLDLCEMKFYGNSGSGSFVGGQPL